MKVTVAHADLARALKIAGKSCSRRPTLPVLSGAKLSVRGLLAITTTDLELSSRTAIMPTVDTTEDDYGTVIVPLTELAGALKNRQPKGATVTLEHDQEANILRVRVGTMHLALRLLDADDYPTLHPLLDGPADTDQLVTDELDQIRAWAERVLPAASNDEARPVLTAVLIERKCQSERCTLTAAATDSYRLHTYQTREYPYRHGPELSFLLPGPALRFAYDTIKAHKATTGAMWWRTHPATTTPSCGYARFQVGPTTIVARAVEGEFPPFEQLMPSTDGASAIDIKDAQAAAAALKTIPTSAERNHIPVVLEQSVAGTVLASVTVQDVGRIELEVPGLKATSTDPFPTIAFNPKLLRELLASNGYGTLHVRDGLKPALSDNGNGFRGLLMPVRIDR